MLLGEILLVQVSVALLSIGSEPTSEAENIHGFLRSFMKILRSYFAMAMNVSFCTLPNSLLILFLPTDAMENFLNQVRNHEKG
jgi:hypothetical protein